MRRVRVEQSAIGTTMKQPHRGDSIVLQFAGVGLSVGGVDSIDSFGGLCKCCRALYTSWLLEMPAKVLTVQSDYK